ncbi:sulfotransferase [Nocardioides pyridinolyticus]
MPCLPGRADRLHAPRPGHLPRLVLLALGRTQLDLCSRAFHAFHDARPRYDRDQFVEIAFEDLVTDPLAATRRVYDRFDLDWTPEVQAAIEEIDHESKQGKARPSHTYTLEDYGLTEAGVRAAFDR